MNIINYIATGLAGSSALTALHQSLKHIDEAPRVDLLGKQVLKKIMGDKEGDFSEDELYKITLAGDILSNSIYYSIIARAKNPVFTGAILGAVGGIITVISPELLGLNKEYVKSSDTKKYLTIGYYLFGGIVAGIVATLLRDNN